MAVGKLSPTANLLRNSRLFSLPPPISQPTQSFAATHKYTSDSATSPYPTNAAIETTQSSLSRGDWGLKRSLPSKSTARTSTPIIWIRNIDSPYNHVEFGSAANHALNLRKWQEMNIPMTSTRKGLPQRASSSGRFTGARSVFESDIDNIERRKGLAKLARWKYQGPWLPGQSEGDFQAYLKKVRGQKSRFRRFLRQYAAEKLALSRRSSDLEEGKDVSHGPVELSDVEFNDFLAHLRRNSEALNALIQEFLDLPPHKTADFESPSSGLAQLAQEPPSTHPSAGLGYLRTSSYIHNHPILGPQERKKPIISRIISPQSSAFGRIRTHALVGVGGVVTNDSAKSMYGKVDVPGIRMFDPDIPGGGKVWERPIQAKINSRGRIDLDCMRADEHLVAIYEGIVDEQMEEPLYKQRVEKFPESNITSSPKKSGTPDYGLNQVEEELNKKVKPSSEARRNNPVSDVLTLLDDKGSRN